MNDNNTIWYVEDITNSNRKYNLTEVEGIISISDNKRKLFRVLNETTNSTFYKGIRVSRTRITIQGNEEDSFKKGADYIERDLINGNEQDREIVLTSKNEIWENLDKEGGIITQ